MKVFGCAVTLLVFSILPSEIKSQGAEITNTVEFDMTIGGQPAGTIVIGLYGKTTPRTANNFYQLAQGSAPNGYVGAPFHRVIPNFMIQGGDFTRQDGKDHREEKVDVKVETQIGPIWFQSHLQGAS